MRPAVLCVALAACGTNPAFDPPAPTGSPAETTAPPTSSGPADTSSSSGPADPASTSTLAVDASGPGDSSSTSPTTTAGTTTDNTTADNTTGAACIAPGGACDLQQTCCGKCTACDQGTCVLNDALCGTCSFCNAAGACEQAKQNAPCDPTLEGCMQQVWGLENGTCYATLPFGRCDKNGTCQENCVDKGAPLAVCDARCVRDDHPCSPEKPAESVSFDALCHHDGVPAGDCISTCNPDGASFNVLHCGMDGTCTIQGEFSCEPYLCTGVPATCTNSCMSSADCAPGHTCPNNTCI